MATKAKVAKRRPNGFCALDVAAHRNRKFLTIDPACIGLWTMGLSYCGDNRTDGSIPYAQVPKLVKAKPAQAYRWADELVTANLWERDGPDYRVHDYLDWNISRAELEELREFERTKKQRMRAGKGEPRPQGSPEGHEGGQPSVSLGDKSGTDGRVPPFVPGESPVSSGSGSGSGSRTTPPSPPSGRLEHRCTHGPSCPEASKPLDADGLIACTGPEGQPLYTWPTPAAKAQRGWLPGTWPFAGVHLDCPDPGWRGRCVDRAYVAAHPERRWFPSAGNGVPRSCPAHQEALREP